MPQASSLSRLVDEQPEKHVHHAALHSAYQYYVMKSAWRPCFCTRTTKDFGERGPWQRAASCGYCRRLETSRSPAVKTVGEYEAELHTVSRHVKNGHRIHQVRVECRSA